MLTRARISLKRRHEVQVKKGGGGGGGVGGTGSVSKNSKRFVVTCISQ